MNDDLELLRAFAEGKSQEAFATLVQQHLPMIYAAAYRQIGDAHRAEEISLAAFSLLARKAGALKAHPAIGGSRYRGSGPSGWRWRRGEGRRRRRVRSGGGKGRRGSGLTMHLSVRQIR